MLRRSRWILAAAVPRDPFEVLGISQDAKPQEIKRAYKKKALKYHPDSSKTGNKEKFQEAKEAFERLKANDFKPGVTLDPEDAARRGYTYDTPGSTKESYVKGKNQALMRIVLMWCAGFVIVRMTFFWLMPPKRRTPVPIAGDAQTPVGSSVGESQQSPSAATTGGGSDVGVTPNSTPTMSTMFNMGSPGVSAGARTGSASANGAPGSGGVHPASGTPSAAGSSTGAPGIGNFGVASPFDASWDNEAPRASDPLTRQ